MFYDFDVPFLQALFSHKMLSISMPNDFFYPGKIILLVKFNFGTNTLKKKGVEKHNWEDGPNETQCWVGNRLNK